MQIKDERVDGMISKLLEVRGKKPGKTVSLTQDDLQYLCVTSREIFIKQPNLLELEAPIKICGKSAGLFVAPLPLVDTNQSPTNPGCR